MRSGGEAEDQHAGFGVAERGDGLAPIFLIEIGAALHARDFAAVVAQAGAERTGDDFALKDREFVHNDISTLAA